MKEKINLDYAFYHFFDHLKTPQCEQIEDLIPDLILTRSGEIDTIDVKLMNEIDKHIKNCKYCEHIYHITENMLLVPVDEPQIKISGNFLVLAACSEQPVESLGEIELTLESVPNNTFKIKLSFDNEFQRFICDFYSRYKLEKYQVIYRNSKDEEFVLFDSTDTGIIPAGEWVEKIELKIKRESFNYMNITRAAFSDTIYIIEK
jgi:hypothetical protein